MAGPGPPPPPQSRRGHYRRRPRPPWPSLRRPGNFAAVSAVAGPGAPGGWALSVFAAAPGSGSGATGGRPTEPGAAAVVAGRLRPAGTDDTAQRRLFAHSGPKTCHRNSMKATVESQNRRFRGGHGPRITPGTAATSWPDRLDECRAGEAGDLSGTLLVFY